MCSDLFRRICRAHLTHRAHTISLEKTIIRPFVRRLVVFFGVISLSFPALAETAQSIDMNVDANVDAIAEPQASSVQFYVEDIKSTMQAYIASQLDADGVFHLLDDKTDEVLDLKFIMVHDPVRQIDGDIYFACTDFHVVGKPDKIYDLDFWMNGKTGELIVYDNKVHKEPRWSWLYGWYKHPRYTFVNDEIEYLY